jgi:hypothetical protein
MCHNAQKISLELDRHKIERGPHPAYSPDISPCDFWLFGFLKEKLKEPERSTSDEIIETITAIWNYATFEELQSVFSEWIQPPICIKRFPHGSAQYSYPSNNQDSIVARNHCHSQRTSLDI